MRLTLGILQVLWMVGVPLALAALLKQRRRWRVPWGDFGLGAAGFVGSQLVHIPLLFLAGPYLPKTLGWQCVILGLAAGLCEEPMRYLVLRRWVAPRDREFPQAVIVGLGHGGIESILLGVLLMGGLLGSLSVPLDAPAAARAAATATLEAAPLDRLLASAERAFAMTFHVAMSGLVMLAARRRWPALLALAIACHALFDAIVVWTHRMHGLIAAEAVGAVGALFAVVIVLVVYRVMAAREDDADAPSGIVTGDVAGPDATQALSTRALTKIFAERKAVDAVTFDVPRGAVFALLGPNGAGKTTTVRMLCALIPISSGSATVAGTRVGGDDDQLRQHVGMLTEMPGLYERLTAWENLELFGRLQGLPVAERRARIEKFLRAFALWDRRDDRVGGFSKGMKQKVAIVRALLHEPSVLFLDEPTSGLDPIAAREVHAVIETLRREGRTILLTTHRLVEAEQLADLVGILRGEMLVLDTFANLKRKMFGHRLEVTLARVDGAFASALGAIGYAEVQVDTERLSIAIEDVRSDAPRIVATLVGAGAEIVGVREADHSLEDIYLGLLRDTPGGSA